MNCINNRFSIKILLLFIVLSILYFAALPAEAFQIAPRITDKQIVQRLTKLDDGQKNLNKRMDDLRVEMNGRFDSLQ